MKNQKIQFKGVAAIITTLSLGGLIMTIALGMAMLSYWLNQNVKSINNANIAFYAASSGLQEAQLRLERNKDFNSSFPLTINGTNDVSVTFSNSSGTALATSTASLGLINKKLQGVFLIDATTTLVIPTSTQELTM